MLDFSVLFRLWVFTCRGQILPIPVLQDLARVSYGRRVAVLVGGLHRSQPPLVRVEVGRGGEGNFPGVREDGGGGYFHVIQRFVPVLQSDAPLLLPLNL